MNDIVVEILLKKDFRNEEAVQKVATLCAKLGMEVRSTGSASISASLDEKHFVQLFGFVPEKIPPQPSGWADFGQSAGYCSEPELAVPKEMDDLVENISACFPHIRL